MWNWVEKCSAVIWKWYIFAQIICFKLACFDLIWKILSVKFLSINDSFQFTLSSAPSRIDFASCSGFYHFFNFAVYSKLVQLWLDTKNQSATRWHCINSRIECQSLSFLFLKSKCWFKFEVNWTWNVHWIIIFQIPRRSSN